MPIGVGSGSGSGGPANLTYTQIETRVMNQLRIPTTNTTEQAKVAALINEVYRDIWIKEDWWFLWARAVINTVVKYTPTSATMTNGSINVTALTPVSTVSLAGYVLVVPGDSNDPGSVYRVATHTASANSLTLDSAFTGTSSTTATPRFYGDAYTLPSPCGKVLLVKRYGEFRPLRRMGLNEISQLKISDQTEGKPEMYSVFDFATTGDPTTQRMLQIHPYPDKTYRLELFYKQELNTELTGTVQPFLPDEYRQILIYGALARGYPIFLNDTKRGDVFQKLFNDLLSLMVATHREYASDKPQMQPDNVYRGTRRRRAAAGAYTLGSWFDRLPISSP